MDLRLLRLSGERRGEEAAGHCTEERSTLHYSITWSARASGDGGIYFASLHKASIASPPVSGEGTVNFNLRSPIAATSSVIVTRRF